MSNLPAPLFYRGSLQSALDQNELEAKQLIDNVTDADFSNASDLELIESVLSQKEVLPAKLYLDSKILDHKDIRVDPRHHREYFHLLEDDEYPQSVPGFRFILEIPYSGDPGIFNLRPSEYRLTWPHAEALPNALKDGGIVRRKFEYPVVSGLDSRIKHEIDSLVNDIQGYLNIANRDVERHNLRLSEVIRAAIEARRNRQSYKQGILKSLGIQTKSDGNTNYAPVLIKKRVIRALPRNPYDRHDPSIRDEDYEYILNVIRHTGASFESTPKTFSVHDEVGLRDITLSNLNSHSIGLATGETFRKKGKADIKIEFENRSAFIAECKVWKGESEVHDALDQLKSYSLWRDRKISLIFFNKSVAGFSGIQKKLPDVLKNHRNYLRDEPIVTPMEWRFIFRSADDPECQVKVHVFLFNVYSKTNVSEGNIDNLKKQKD
jgi:hypothetical protein